jgi:hypothetical protein
MKTAIYAIILLLGALYLAWCVVAAQQAQSLFVGGPVVASQPWGWVTITDLYLGFLVFGAYIGVREGSAARSAPWWLALFFLGNIASAGYVLAVLIRSGFDSAALLRREPGVRGPTPPTPPARSGV